MKTYIVKFDGNDAVSALPTQDYKHGEVGLNEENNMVDWVAMDSTDDETAMEVADRLVKKIWGERISIEESLVFN